MAVTIAWDDFCIPLKGGYAMRNGKVTFDDSYALAGEVFDISAKYVATATPRVFITPISSGFHVVHDNGTCAGGKLRVFGTGSAEKAAGTEVDAATDLHLLECMFTVIAKVP